MCAGEEDGGKKKREIKKEKLYDQRVWVCVCVCVCRRRPSNQATECGVGKTEWWLPDAV